MSRVSRLAGAVVLALVAVGVWRAPAAEAVCPAGPWGCPNQGYAQYRGANRSGEHVVVVGDSLVQNAGPAVADRLAGAGFVSFTIGARGYAYWHWNNGVAQGLDIGDYVSREHADHVVLALGTNDARVLAAKPAALTADDVRAQLRRGTSRALAASRGCVILVSPSQRSHAPEAREVRALIRATASTSHRFAVADWGARSAGHEEWFVAPGNVHLSPAGNAAYAGFLTEQAEAARSGALGC
jgi:lysophospholipase L1-like esterase